MSRCTTILAVLGALMGCAHGLAPRPEEGTRPYRFTAEGRVVWQEEFEFEPPQGDWRLLQVEEGDEFSFAFLRAADCAAPCQSTFAYDEEPFGYSRDLAGRMEEFYRRFLWGSRVAFGPVRTRTIQLPLGEALEGVAEASDPVRGEKVLTRVILAHRGERVVSFYLTQWRPLEAAFDLEEPAVLDRFASSFRFLRPSFHEAL